MKVSIYLLIGLVFFYSITKSIRARVTISEGVRVLNSINELKPLVLEALKAVVAKKSAIINSKSIFNYVADDLTELNLTTVTLENLLISRTPVRVIYFSITLDRFLH